MKACAVITCLTLGLSVGCSYRLIRKGKLDLGRFQQVQARLAATRELAFVKPVPVEIVSAADARQYLKSELREELTPIELDNLTMIYSRLGLIDQGVDLEKALLDLYQEQVAGFYDAEKEKLFLVKEIPAGHLPLKLASVIFRRDLAGEMFLAHELTHALQNQHFDIAKHLKEKKQDDRSLARRAVYEGDATLSGLAALTGHLSENMLERILSRLAGVPGELERRYPAIPPALRETLVFQYLEGARFVAEAYRRGGWKAVDATIQYPPLSTEQIMHLDKYFGSPDLPIEVGFGGFQLSPGKWELVEENTMGELMIATLVRKQLSREEAGPVAGGWDGDRLAAFQHRDEICILWLSVWDTEEDAIEFFLALDRILQHLRQEMEPAANENSTLVNRPSGSYYIERRGSRVLLLDHPPGNRARELALQIWKESTFQTQAPELNSDRAWWQKPTGPEATSGANPNAPR